MTDNSDASRESITDASTQRKQSGIRLSQLLAMIAMAVILVALLVALMLPAVRSAGPAARRVQCGNNVKQIAVALYNYHDRWNAFPPAFTVDAGGNPLHSWRTLILPYLAHQTLYETIDLSKAWNDSANIQAYETRISAYCCPSIDIPDTHTTYMAVVASGSFFRATEPRRLSEITDDTAKTIMVIEMAPEHAVHWMSPLDADEKLVLGFEPKTKLPHSGGLHAAFVDGSVRFLTAETPAADRRQWISISGNDN